MCILRCKKFLLTAVCLWLSQCGWAANKPDNIIVLDGPSNSPTALFVQELLEQAYLQLGYQVEYQKVPLARSFVEANSGHIDGLRARVKSVPDTYKNLLRVPFPIVDFEIMLLGNSGRCGQCTLQEVKNLAVPRGYLAITEYIAKGNYKIDMLDVISTTKALQMLKAQRVDAVVVADVNLPEQIQSSETDWTVNSLTTLADYHYLHKRHKDLVLPLTKVLKRMSENGQLAAIKAKYIAP